jgi:hypothetical protein
MGANTLLVLNMPGFKERVSALEERLTSDSSLRELFVRDPANVILKTVFPDENVPSAEVTRGNRLLFALLTNEKFMAWAENYQKSLVEKAIRATKLTDPNDALRTYLAVVDRSAIHRDVAEAVAQTADTEVIAAFTWRPDFDASQVPGPRGSIAVDVEVFVYAVALAAVFVAAFGLLVGVATNFGGPVAGTGIDRAEVRKVANQLAERLVLQGHELRGSGALTEFGARNAGFLRASKP